MHEHELDPKQEEKRQTPRRQSSTGAPGADLEMIPQWGLPEPGRLLLSLQANRGNQSVQRVVAAARQGSGGMTVQARLLVGPAQDEYEREADRLAEQVASGSHQSSVAVSGPSETGSVKTILRKPLPAGGKISSSLPVSPQTEAAIHQARGSGSQVPESFRMEMEGAMGADFSGVRLHTGAHADRLNQELNARAFTTGQDIFFRRGEYQPDRPVGRELLAHELAHVVQQTGAEAAVQRKLGFEIEMLVLVDANGRPVPEKQELGTIGGRLDLTVDQNSEADSPTPAAAATANYDLPPGWQKRAVDDSGHAVDPYFINPTTGESSQDHPLGPGMGRDRYASILEIVTKAYEPETDPGAVDLRAAMRSAQEFAQAIRPRIQRNERFLLNTVPNVTVIDPNTHIGNPSIPNKQSVFGSIQTNLGISIAQFAPMLESMLGPDDDTGGPANQEYFKLKHSSEFMGEEGDFLRKELLSAVNDADEVIEEFRPRITRFLVFPKSVNLDHLRGLFTLICQYLRLGKHLFFQAQDPNDPTRMIWRAGLDKNAVALMSRTDLSTIYRSLPKDDRAWMDQKTVAAVSQRLLGKTGRSHGSTLLTDPTQAAVSRDGITVTCQQFLTNVFTRDDDGVTQYFGGIQEMGPEVVYRGAKPRSGPVFEIRNMIPGLGGRQRFPPDDWPLLAEYFIQLLRALNTRAPREQGAVPAASLGLEGPARPDIVTGSTGTKVTMGRVLG